MIFDPHVIFDLPSLIFSPYLAIVHSFPSPQGSSSSFSTDSAIQSGSAATFPLQTRPFLTEPDEEAYLAREGERGPALNCSVAEQYRDRKRFELEWTKIVGDTPM